MMRIRSFRFRIALSTALLAGGVLLGFGAIAWWSIHDAKVRRLDALLENLVLQTGPLQGPDELAGEARWSRYEARLKQRLADSEVELLVLDRQGNSYYQSANFPENLSLQGILPPFPQPISKDLGPGDSPQAPGNGSQANSALPLSPGNRPQPPGIPPQLPGNAPHSASSPPQPPGNVPQPSGKPPGSPPQPPGGRPQPLVNLPELQTSETTSDDNFTHQPRRPAPQAKFGTRRADRVAWRVVVVAFPRSRVAIAINLKTIDREMATIRNIFLILMPAMLLLVAVGAWAISGSALGAIARLTQAMQQVSIQGLDQRLPAERSDLEFQALIQVFNQMLGRLERSFKQASRFSGDAAHELKTPLAVLQGDLEQTLQELPPGSPSQQRISKLLDEVRRLSQITRKLLLLSLADAGKMALYRQSINLSPLLAEMGEDLELFAPELTIKTKIANDLWVEADRDLLVQVLQNLLSNAIKYNLPQGWIELHAEAQGHTLEIAVTNASKDWLDENGNPDTNRDRIFERFYRCDRDRTSPVEGTGLGLSLAREIVQAHGGQLALMPPISGQTTLLLTLPSKKV